MDRVFNPVVEGGPQPWVTALAAVQAFAIEVGVSAAQSKLLSLVQLGELRGRADFLIEEADIGTLILDEEHWGWRDEHPKSHPAQRDKSRIQLCTDDRPVLTVPTDFFASADGWVVDPLTVSWPEGVIVARRPATFRPRLNTALLKNPVVVGGASRIGRLKSPPALPETDAYMRRAVKGIMFQHRDILHFASGPGAVATEGKPGRPTTNLDVRAEYCLPGDCEPVMEKFRAEIASGEFEVRYKHPMAHGVRAKIGRDFERRMQDDDLGVPSSATLKRKVNRLVDEFKVAKRRKNTPDPL